MYAFMLKPPEAMKPQHDKTFEKKITRSWHKQTETITDIATYGLNRSRADSEKILANKKGHS